MVVGRLGKFLGELRVDRVALCWQHLFLSNIRFRATIRIISLFPQFFEYLRYIILWIMKRESLLNHSPKLFRAVEIPVGSRFQNYQLFPTRVSPSTLPNFPSLSARHYETGRTATWKKKITKNRVKVWIFINLKPTTNFDNSWGHFSSISRCHRSSPTNRTTETSSTSSAYSSQLKSTRHRDFRFLNRPQFFCCPSPTWWDFCVSHRICGFARTPLKIFTNKKILQKLRIPSWKFCSYHFIFFFRVFPLATLGPLCWFPRLLGLKSKFRLKCRTKGWN